MLEAVLKQVGKVEYLAVVCIHEGSCLHIGKRLREMCLKHGHAVAGVRPPFAVNGNTSKPTYVYFFVDEGGGINVRRFDKVFADHAVYDFWLAPRYHWFDWMREGEEAQ